MTVAWHHAIALRLLDWSATHLRDLPWRRSRDPYAVWISEIMLQQTQVATVIPYYERFLARFPTLHALAAAPLDDVLKVWAGLGYYARARNLHAAAREVEDQFGGALPADREALLRLPGIGRYTVGAILSLAFGQDAPVLDGNVRRVLCRLFAVQENPRQPATEAYLWDLAAKLLPAGRAGRFNEALMDLGATLCTPRQPRCPACPLADLCQAHQLGLQDQLPAPAPRRATPHYDVTAGVIWHEDRLLIAQRPLDKLLGGLWEFPGGKCEPGESLDDCLQREIREELGIDIEVNAPLTVVRHAYTHFRITLHAFQCRLVSGEPRALGGPAWRWVRLEDLDGFAFPVTDRRIIGELRGTQP